MRWSSRWRASSRTSWAAARSRAGVEGDVGVGVELAANPTDADPVDGLDASDGRELVLDLVDEIGVDAVHKAAVDVAGGVAQHVEDGGADGEADDGVGEWPAGHRTEGGGEHGIHTIEDATATMDYLLSKLFDQASRRA
jgi:hypothetical protein